MVAQIKSNFQNIFSKTNKVIRNYVLKLVYSNIQQNTPIKQNKKRLSDN